MSLASSSVALPPGPAWADGPAWSGHVESQWRARSTDGSVLALGQRLWLEGHGAAGADAWFVSGRLDWDPKAGYRSPRVQATMHEAAFSTGNDTLRLDLGLRRLRWGASDGRSVLDVANPPDLSDPFAGGTRSTARLPTWQASLEGAALQGRWQFVWVPRAGVARLPEPGSPWEPALLRARRAAAGAAATRVETVDEPEHGLRWVRYGSGLDVEALVWRGPAREPVALPGARFVAPPVSTLGLGLQGAAGGHGLRGELAWEPDAPLGADGGEVVRTRRQRAVLGWDHQWAAGPYANLQAYADRWSPSRATAARSVHRHGVTYLLRHRFGGDGVEAGVRGVRQASDGSGVAELYLQWDPDDRWRLGAGAVHLWGEADSEYGLWRGLSFMRLTARWSF